MREFTRPVLSSFPLHFRTLLHEQTSCSNICISRNPIGHQTRLRHHAQIRCAHNLSDRYKRLETKIRPLDIQRKVVAGEVYDVKPTGQQAAPVVEVTASQPVEMEEMSRGGSKSILRPKPRLFKGVLIPIKPPPPASDGE